MSDEILQYAIIGAVVALAVWYLLRQFGGKGRRKGCCGCGDTRSCGSGKKGG